MRTNNLFVAIIVAIATIFTVSCGKNIENLDLVDPQKPNEEPKVENVATYYWIAEKDGCMDVYDQNKELLFSNVPFSGWKIVADVEKSHIGSTGTTLKTTSIGEVADKTYKVTYEAIESEHTFEVKVSGISQKYEGTELKPLYELVLYMDGKVAETSTKPRFVEKYVVTTELEGNGSVYATATTTINVAEEKMPVSITITDVDDNGDNADVNFNDGSTVRVKVNPALVAQGEHNINGHEELKISGDNTKDAKCDCQTFEFGCSSSVVIDSVEISGTLSYQYTYEGETFSLPFTNDFVVMAELERVATTKDEKYSYYQEYKCHYDLKAQIGENYISLANDYSTFVVSEEMTETPPAEPKALYWIHLGNDKIGIVYDDNSVVEDNNVITMKAEDEKEFEGNESLTIAENEKTKNTEASLIFANNYWNNEIVTNGNINGNITHNGVEIPYGGGNVKTVAGDPIVTTSENAEYSFFNEGYIPYVTRVSNDGGETFVDLAECKQYYTVYMAKAVEPAKPTGWKQADDKEGVIYFDDETSEKFDNLLTMKAGEKQVMEGTTALTLNVNSMQADNDMSFGTNYFDGEVAISGNLGQNVDFGDWKDIPCNSTFEVTAEINVTTDSEEGYDFYNEGYILYTLYADGNEVASCKQEYVISKKTEVTVKDILREYVHKLLRPVAEVKDNKAITTCDNDANMTTLMTDDSKVDAETIAYTVKHTFVLDGNTSFIVNNLNEIVGQNGNIASDGSFSVAGKDFVISLNSYDVSDINYKGNNYSNEALKCSVTPSTYDVTQDKLIITFVNEDEQTCTAEFKIKVDVINIIPGDVEELIFTDYYYAHGDAKNRRYKLAGVAGHARRSDGTVYSFDVTKGVNSGFSTKTNVKGTYAWYELTLDNWVLGLVEAKEVDEANTDYRLEYFSLEKKLAIVFGSAEAALSTTNYRNPVHKVTVENGVYTVTIDGKTYKYASQQ